MPPKTSKPTPKRKAPAFKPPRPAAGSKSTYTSTKTPAPRRKSSPAKSKSKRPSFIADEASASDDDDEDEEGEDDDVMSSIEPQQDASESDSDVVEMENSHPPPTIPPVLLTKLLHYHFKDDNMRIGKEAGGVVGKYMETFIREAIARAGFERAEVEASQGGGRRGGGGGWQGGFLEVSSLVWNWGLEKRWEGKGESGEWECNANLLV